MKANQCNTTATNIAIENGFCAATITNNLDKYKVTTPPIFDDAKTAYVINQYMYLVFEANTSEQFDIVDKANYVYGEERVILAFQTNDALILAIR